MAPQDSLSVLDSEEPSSGAATRALVPQCIAALRTCSLLTERSCTELPCTTIARVCVVLWEAGIDGRAIVRHKPPSFASVTASTRWGMLHGRCSCKGACAGGEAHSTTWAGVATKFTAGTHRHSLSAKRRVLGPAPLSAISINYSLNQYTCAAVGVCKPQLHSEPATTCRGSRGGSRCQIRGAACGKHRALALR